MTKNYKFTAYDSKGNEINLKCAYVFYNITEEEAKGIRIGLEFGLYHKYKEPRVTFREVTEQETKEQEERLAKALGF